MAPDILVTINSGNDLWPMHGQAINFHVLPIEPQEHIWMKSYWKCDHLQLSSAQCPTYLDLDVLTYKFRKRKYR